MHRPTIILITLICSILNLRAMDFGLRFNAQDSPTDRRTSITVGEMPYDLGKEFKIGFFFNFYNSPMFGNILSLKTDDGQRIAVFGSVIEDGTYRLGLVVNDKLVRLKTPLVLDPSKEDHVDVILDKANNNVTLSMNNNEISTPVDLSSAKSVTVGFGRDKDANQADVAPIELRNIRIFQDGRNTHHWDFKYHDTDSTTIDDLGGHTALIENPYWLINDHTDWKQVFSLKTTDRIQTAFDPKRERLLIVDDDKLTSLDLRNGKSSETPITSGRRVMAFSNHLYYDSITDRLINYNLHRKGSVFLDMNGNSWSAASVATGEEPNYSNHSVAVAGDTLFAFGGYGFYTYHDDMYTVDLKTGQVARHALTPPLMPMTSAASAVVGDNIYIFGGRGNESGRQELPARYSYALYEYDINTWDGRRLWELDSVENDFLPTQTMYYDKEDDCFYMGVTEHGGKLIRISRSRPELKVLSTKIKSKMDFHDFVFDLYRSNDGKRFYLVIDKRLDAKNHDMTVYSISTPFLEEEDVINNKIPNTAPVRKEESGSNYTLWIVGCILLLIIIVAGCAVWARRRKTKPQSTDTDTVAATPLAPEPAESIEASEPTAPQEESGPPETTISYSLQESQPDESEDFSFMAMSEGGQDTEFFDRTRSSVSFLGGFCVRDKEGNDITVKFTARLKHLLILLLLASHRYESGIKYQLIDEEIWGDKDEKSAQNNRNVSMRKLRMLLEEIGNIVITYDKGYFKINTNEVMFDYKELMSRITEIKGSDSVTPELVNQTLELLLMGPMLPNTHYDWLDKYKADFSNSALEILGKLLKYELRRDDNLAYRIAETISLHDVLNEEALFAKCQILSRRKMLGLARNIYAGFCKEYLKSMGEEYHVTFPEACKKEI